MSMAPGLLLAVLSLGCAASSSPLPLSDEAIPAPVDTFFNRALKSLNSASLESTTLGKPGHLEIRSSVASPLAIPASRLAPPSALGRGFQPVPSFPVPNAKALGVSHETLFPRPLAHTQQRLNPAAAFKPATAVFAGGPETDEKAKIISIIAREVLDSRGNPTVEAELTTGYGTVSAIVPSGASTGAYEALELRDDVKGRYRGKGVVKAVENIRDAIAPELKGKDVRFQKDLDEFMVQKLDATENEWGWKKGKLGANAILAVSMCLTRAGAQAFGLELFEYIGELKATAGDASGIDVARAKARKYKMPVPMMNVINGGVHAGNRIPMQEFMIAPTGAKSFKEALQVGTEVYHALGSVVKKKYGPDAAAVGDEGGFAPNSKSEEEGLECLMTAIKDAGHTEQVKLAMDVAATEFYVKGDNTYNLGFKDDNPSPDSVKSRADMIEFYKNIVKKYPLVSIEDPFDEDDWEAWSEITKDIGSGVQIVGDDLLVTNCKRISFCKEKKAANALLLKVNQIGTITESIGASLDSVAEGWGVMVSHRSGETEDTFIADMAVGLSSGQIKTGAPCRSERVAKYNQLLRIEEKLGDRAVYAGADFRKS